MPPGHTRIAALRVAAALLADAAEHMPAEPVSADLTDGFHRIIITVEPVQYSLSTQQQDPAGNSRDGGLRLLPEPEPPRLTPLDQLILASAPADPVTMPRLARLSGNHDPDSYFQARVRRLVALGLLARDFRGYRRA